MRKIKTFLWLVIMVGLAGGGIYNMYKYFSGQDESENKAKIENYGRLINEGEVAIAIFDSIYSERRIKGIVVSKEIDYTFEVDNNTYGGTYSFKEDNFPGLMKVTFLKSNPEIHSFDPQKDLTESTSKKGSKSNLWFGLGALLIGVLGALFNFKRLTAKSE